MGESRGCSSPAVAANVQRSSPRSRTRRREVTRSTRLEGSPPRAQYGQRARELERECRNGGSGGQEGAGARPLGGSSFLGKTSSGAGGAATAHNFPRVRVRGEVSGTRCPSCPHPRKQGRSSCPRGCPLLPPAAPRRERHDSHSVRCPGGRRCRNPVLRFPSRRGGSSSPREVPEGVA